MDLTWSNLVMSPADRAATTQIASQRSKGSWRSPGDTDSLLRSIPRFHRAWF